MNATSFVTTIPELWWTYVAHSFWQSTLVAVIALIVVWALRKRSAAFLYAILLVALLKFLVPPIIPAAVLSDAAPPIAEQREEAAFPQTTAPATAPTIPAMTTEFPLNESSAPDDSAITTDSQAFAADKPPITETATTNITPIPPQNTQWYSGVDWKLALIALHAFGAISLALVMVSSYLKLKGVLRHSIAPSGALNALHQNVCARMRLTRVELRITPARCAPMATGIFKRYVILPEALASLDEDELRAILAHELAHHRRFDLAVVWLEHAIALLWWFNPVFWLLIRALHRKREDCCDDIVLKMELSGHGEYCRTLLRAAKQLQQPATPSFVFGCANKLHPLGYRMARIMDCAVRRRTSLTLSGIAGIVLACLFLLPTFVLVSAEPVNSAQPAPTAGTETMEIAPNVLLQAPRIISTIPPIGDTNVDPATSEIRITFDQDMFPTGSLARWDENGRSKTYGKPTWIDKRTCALKVSFIPGTFYSLRVNRLKANPNLPMDDFRGENGVYASADCIYFATREPSAIELAKAQPPKIVSLLPGDSAQNVTPGPTTLIIRFDKPMFTKESEWFTSTSFVVLDGDYPAVLGAPAWNDSMTCTLAVNLKTATTYKVGLNGDASKWFQSEFGVPLKRIVWTFTTVGAQAPAPIDTVTTLTSDPVGRIEDEIKAYYTKADAEVQEYIRWTARNFGGSGLWFADDAFATTSPEDRERMIASNAEVMQGEYGRHLCKALAESGALKDARLLPGLIKVASYHRDDYDYDCRPKWMAAAALGRQDDISVVPTLVPLVDHGNQNTRMWARASLVRLTGQNFSADKQAWGKWWNESGNQPPIDLSQLKPWTPAKSAATTSVTALAPVGTGPTGNVLRFDGKDDYVAIPTAAALDLKETLSVSAWVRVAEGCCTEAPIFRRGDARPGLDPYVFGVYGNKMHFAMFFHEGPSHDASPMAVADLDANWHHWCGVRDAAAGMIRLYKDGQLVNEAPAPGTIPYDTTSMTNEIGAVDRGYWSRGSNWGFLNGDVDQISVWNVARTADDIAKEVREGLKGDEPGLAALWKFDEDGQEIVDSSPSNIAATLGSSPDADSNDPQRIPARDAFASSATSTAQPAPPVAPVVGEAVVPAESQAIVDALPGDLIAKATYHHRSRGSDFPVPSTMWCKRNADGTIVAASYMPSMNTTNVAYTSNERGINRYENCFHGRDGRPAGKSVLTVSGEQVTVAYEGGEKDGQTETYAVPAKNGYQPNSRPDPYIAHMGLAMLDHPQKDIELACFDWDNTGKGMATYDTKVEYKGKEDVTVPAGTFTAHHYVETQTTFGDTWFKKRPGHVTEYWLLDNGLMVRILRHREPYELLLASVELPKDLPGFLGSPEPKPAGKLTILSARYGAQDKWIDLAELLNSRVQNDTLEVFVSNELGGDPIDGVQKKLHVEYRVGDKTYATAVDELGTLRLPETGAKPASSNQTSQQTSSAPAQSSNISTAAPPKSTDTTVTGKVTDLEGNPIVGAELWIRNWESGESHSAKGESGADGTFTLKALPSNSRLFVNANGYASMFRTADVQQGVNRGWDFILPKSAQVLGRIVDTKGNPAPNRVIELWPVNAGPPPAPGASYIASGGFDESKTNEDGVFNMPNVAPGKHRVIVYRSVPSADRNLQQVPLKGRFFEVKSGDRIEDMEILLNAPEDFVLSGHVRNAAGTPVANVGVDSFIPHGRHWWTKTGSDGAFRLEGLDGIGQSKLRLFFNDVEGAQGYKLAINDAPLNTTDLNFIIPGKGAIQGTVRNAKTGESIKTYEVRVPILTLPDSGAVWEEPSVEVVRNDDGTFTLSKVPAGDVTVEVRADGLGAQRFTIPIKADTITPLDCNMLGPAVFEGRTTGNGKPRKTTIVINGEWLSSDDAGNYRFDAYPNGKMWVWFFENDGRHRSVDVDLKSGETVRSDIDMGGSCKITGSVKFPDDEEDFCTIRLSSKPAPDGWYEFGRPAVEECVLAYSHVRKSGDTYELGNLPPGRWYLMAGKYTPPMHRSLLAESREIDLKDGETLSIDFDLMKADK